MNEIHSIQDSDPSRLSLLEASELLRRQEISPLELTEACLTRIEDQQPAINAFSYIDSNGATAAAQSLGQNIPSKISNLWGIPISVKDLIHVKGMPTKAGSQIFEQAENAHRDAGMIKHFREIGSVLLGKTHTHEFAFGVSTPQTKNPLDHSRIVGGSSGGAAASVAAYQSFAAIGTDTGGSVRIPASLCGLSGLKTRRSSVSREGIIPLSPMLDSVGFITRSIHDLTALWESFIGEHSNETTHLRIGVVDRSTLGFLSPAVLASWESAIAALSKIPGIELSYIKPPDFDEWTDCRIPPLLTDAYLTHTKMGLYPSMSERYSDTMRLALERGKSIDKRELGLAYRKSLLLADSFMKSLDNVDVAFLPTTSIIAPKIEDSENSSAELLRLTAPINWCALASVTVPGKISQEGMPTGMQFVAKNEHLALLGGRLLESALNL